MGVQAKNKFIPQGMSILRILAQPVAEKWPRIVHSERSHCEYGQRTGR